MRGCAKRCSLRPGGYAKIVQRPKDNPNIVQEDATKGDSWTILYYIILFSLPFILFRLLLDTKPNKELIDYEKLHISKLVVISLFLYWNNPLGQLRKICISPDGKLKVELLPETDCLIR